LILRNKRTYTFHTSRSHKKGRILWILAILFIVFLLAMAAYVFYLDKQVTSQFEGKRWEVPSRVFARPLELYAGQVLSMDQLTHELQLLRYSKSKRKRVGSYSRRSDRLLIRTRPFEFWDENLPSILLEVNFSGTRIESLRNAETDEELDIWRLEPLFIGGIYPKINEDRILVRRQDVPELLVDTLLAVEDRKFYEHWGIAPTSILRALLANIRAGAKVQGGSTLTQQLVKNFYLSNEKTIVRKLNEAIMALLLEWHYEKDEILEAYLNEVYLGQDGRRAIHGFGLAAQFYFDEPLETLDAQQIALLVGLVKGASYYDPRRFPERASKRRNLVITVQSQSALINAKQLAKYITSPLGVSKDKPHGVSRYPAFIDLVKRQLHEDYQPEDLHTAGLRLYTTLDPLVQYETEQSILKRLPQLERKNGLADKTLEVAAMITDTGSGSVRAMVGGRAFRSHGFNRALDARRHIGSLIKPAVYLTALSNPRQYALNTLLDDIPISIQMENGRDWSPSNYDNRFHGSVSLISSLANSYNAATVRLGMQLGLDKISETIYNLGVERKISPYPSMLLGAVDMTVYEVQEMYQTLSAQGFQTPVRAIHAVTNANGETLSKYSINIKQTVKAESVYLLNTALQEVTKTGTAKKIYKRLPLSFNLAGKTGTTNDYRDSWFAGMTGDKVAVVWIGADDNRSVNLTGSSGALNIWTDVIAETASKSLELPKPERIKFANMNAIIHNKSEVECRDNMQLPYVTGFHPKPLAEFDCQ